MTYLLHAVLNNTLPALRTRTLGLLQRSTVLTKSLVHRGYNPQSTVKNIRWNCTRAYDLNTNVAKDVILFKYENPRFYKVLNIFAVCQLIFWTYLSHFAYTTLKDAPIDRTPDVELAWYQRINLGENKYRNGITLLCVVFGYGIFAAACLYTLRSVRFLILRKGGRDVSIVTYGPFGKNLIMTVPLQNISALEARQTASSQLPLKVQNKSLFYLLDMRGEFKNPQLYDYTAGLKRKL